MTRRNVFMLFLPLVLIAAAVFAPLTAAAQDVESDRAVYPGPFGTEQSDTTESSDDTTETDEVLGQTLALEDLPTNTDTNVLSIPDVQVNPVSVAASAASDATPALANTGSEVEPIIAISVGMLAVGGSILVGSRRRLRDFFN